ncbi:MAG: Crp/Fnr family transcriptional regulator [Capnocytophaga sp.]|nr:Crp/Fnr family transcriptional regulator [Capnocytophaga sp.]
MKQKLRQHFEKIVSLTDTEFEFVSSFFEKKTFLKHQFLVQENNAVNYDFWIIEGLVKAYKTDTNGKLHILQFAMEDWWITDYRAYFNQTLSNLNIDCLENTQVYCLSLENREKICNEIQQMNTFFRKKTSKGYVALQQRILSMLTSKAKERYEEFLQLYPSLPNRLPKHIIASYLGVSRETLSRLY